jgi:hypothetical protein
VRADGGLGPVSVIRDFEPGDRVAARIEIARGGILRGTSAGVDVMGDGTLVPFAGSVGRRQLDAASGGDAFEVVKRELG